MYYLKLVFKNIFRHRLRSLLTMVGLVVAILAFGLLQTVVNAWYAGADMASANRLITRNATSLVDPIAEINNYLLPIWMIVLGVTLIRWRTPSSIVKPLLAAEPA